MTKLFCEFFYSIMKLRVHSNTLYDTYVQKYS